MLLLWTLAGQVGGVEASNHSLDDGNSRFIMLDLWTLAPQETGQGGLGIFACLCCYLGASRRPLQQSHQSRLERCVLFSSKLPLVDPSGSQTIIHSQNGGTILQLPSEYFSEELEDANGRLEGVLHLVEKRTTAPKVRDFTLDIPLEAVSSDRLDKFLKKCKKLARLKFKGYSKWSAMAVLERRDCPALSR